MNYSVFKLQNQGGKPSIFWEKDEFGFPTVPQLLPPIETVPKKDRKFGYKQRNQRFPVRRYADDRHHVDTDLVSLTPEEPHPPPKPVKNFIQRNREKVKKPEGTVTLTQEQLNAILRSVGKVAGGSENAVKISIDQKDKTHSEVLVESPRRHDNDDEYDDQRERRRKKKSSEKKQEDNSIYSFLDGKSKGKSTSDNESQHSEGSVEQTRDTKKSHRRQDRKSRRTDEDNDDDYNEEPVRDRKRRNKSKREVDNDADDNDYDGRTRKPVSKNRQDELDNEINGFRHRIRLEGEDSDTELREVRRRRNRSKPRDSEDDDEADIDRPVQRTKSERHRKDEGSKERQRKARKESEERVANESLTKKDDELIPSPRDKIGLPNDLSWRHMTKAERRRLEIARQKFDEGEEKKEEDRIQQLNAKYAPDSVLNLKPQRHKGPHSDPATRVTRADIGRTTDLSNYTDNNRRGRHSRTPSPDINEPAHSSPVDASPKTAMGIPRRHMTLAEKKRLEWEKDRVETVALQQHVGNYDPWGRPGAGAPLRTKSGHVVADYKGRQELLQNASEQAAQQESSGPSAPRVEDKGTSRKVGRRPRSRSPAAPAPSAPTQQPLGHQAGVPLTMRSSFVLGQAAPDINLLESAKERERKKWRAELEQQIEEKRQRDLNRPRENDETWAEKFGRDHRPIPFPEQTRDPGGGGADMNTSADGGGGLLPLESHRDTSSAPEQGQEQSYLRGQNVPLDPATKREVEEKRRRYLEHQAAVRAQVEEKERQKRVERERKQREDMEEERKLQAERDALKSQFELEQQKIKQKEQQRQTQVNQLKAAMDEAQAKALQEKYQRKMQHLEAGGHDTKKLREHLEAIELNLNSRVTPRDNDDMVVVEPSHIPGLDLHTSRQPGYQATNRGRDASTRHEPYQEDRVLTPSRLRRPSKPWSDPSSPRREFGTQTVDNISRLVNPALNRDYSEVDIQYKFDKGKKVRVVSAPKEEKRAHKSREPTREPRPPPSHSGSTSPHDHHHEVKDRRERMEVVRKKKLEEKMRKGPVRPGSRPKWGYKNPAAKKPQKQSEKDPFYEQKKKESDERRVKREQQLLALVEANKDIIPDYYVPDSQRISRSRSRSKSPFSDIEMASPREVKLNRRSRSMTSLTPESHGHHGDSYHTHNKGSHKEGWNRHRSPSPPDSEVRQTPSHDNVDRPSRSRVKSPPVPAIRRKTDSDQKAENAKRGGKYDDADPLNKPVQNGDFVPFTRTIEVLDPSKAEEPLPLSREATRVANARRKYFESLHPNQFGDRQYPLKDEHRPFPGNPNDRKNPIINPGLVLDRPTNRQDQILVQLSTLKQSLMQRQRELETFSPTDLMRYNTDIKA
ncbi:trichohyalin-like isoform X3 [Dreissena polymorpha]|uniref:trichohyalin-like isoform X3 n=1 Tax=Dreissena polymorpha TaxID=45954 RepID=UPI002263C5C6|nr:trichohyalin-like isoform X3 [Dreissena polymorpha]